MQQPRFLYLQLHLLVALLATTAILGALISLPAVGLVIWRTFLASAGALLVIGLVQRRSVLPPRGALLPLLAVGGIVGLHWICFFGAIRLANVSICLAGMATITFFTAFTEPWLERRPVRMLEVLLGLLVLVGILIVAKVEQARLGGLAAALLGALLAAIFPVLNRRLVRQAQMDPLVMVAWEMAGACLVCLLAWPWLGGTGWAGLFAWQRFDWLWLVVLAWVCTVFAHGFHIHLLRHLSAYTGNLALNFEPIYGITAAALLFGEHRQLHPGFFAGTAAILLANIAHPVLRKLKAEMEAQQRMGD